MNLYCRIKTSSQTSGITSAVAIRVLNMDVPTVMYGIQISEIQCQYNYCHICGEYLYDRNAVDDGFEATWDKRGILELYNNQNIFLGGKHYEEINDYIACCFNACWLRQYECYW